MFSKIRKLTFKELLDIHFKNSKLKSILSSLLLGNVGLPPSLASALVAMMTYREFVFDGGYYPIGGMQVIPDRMVDYFKKHGGEILLSAKVTKIFTKNKRVVGIEIDGNNFISAKFIVSNADASHTFKEILDCPSKESMRINNLDASISVFSVFLGLKKEFDASAQYQVTWLFSNYDVEKCYRRDLLKTNLLDGILCTIPSIADSSLAPRGKTVLRLVVKADYGNKILWQKRKNILCGLLIDKVSSTIPGLRNNIEVSVLATPHTFFSYTNNYRGAMLGWQATPSQTERNIFPSCASINNLYLVGHWVTSGMGQSGIALVASSGRYAASRIISKFYK
jgi:all-trans-retinol 13,14-reductase